MKKILLSLAGGLTALCANAQYAKHLNENVRSRYNMTAQNKQVPVAPRHSAARTTATCFTGTETFGSGTATTLPTGWTIGIISGSGSWRWQDVASGSDYTMGAFNSTSAADGWMIFNSDSIGFACSCAPAGWLQSPAYNCSGQSTVRLNFENFYRSFNDSCSVWVGTDPAFASGTYQVYPVAYNNNTPTNSYTPNPSKIRINITGAAANEPAVYIRFVYYGYDGGSYSWMIDNVCLSDVDPHDAIVADGFVVLPDPTAYNGSLVTTPLKFVDTVFPVAFLNNLGANPETNVQTTATIYQGSTSVYTDNVIYPTLPLDAVDSPISFGGYKPNAMGDYTCVFNTTLTGDADLASNTDTVRFTVTDTLWQQNAGNINSIYLYNASASPVVSYMQGTRFDIPLNAESDTVSGFAVSFSASSDTVGTGTVSVQLYSIQADGTSWLYLGASVSRPISELQWSHPGNTKWTDFRIDAGGMGDFSPFVLHQGYSYAAIVQMNGIGQDLLVNATPASRGSANYYGYLGQFDESSNDGNPTFGSTQATGNASSVPMVRLYTGSLPTTAVHDVSNAIVTGKVYPNPANSSVNIPFTTGSNTKAVVSIANIVGQVVKVQEVGATAGNQATAIFNTADMPAGVYMYTITANGQHTTGRIVVAH